MGGFETGALAFVEPTLKYHPCVVGILTSIRESGWGTVSGRQFDWGGRLPKCNGGAQRFPQHGRQSCVECKGIRELDCETDKSNRHESGSIGADACPVPEG